MKRILALVLSATICAVAIGGELGFAVKYDGGTLSGAKVGDTPYGSKLVPRKSTSWTRRR